MGDAFDPEPQGAALSFLDWIDKPGQVVRNVFKGNLKGAAKNFGDFLLDPIDAMLPGDLIPQLAGEEDKVSGSQLINVDEKEHPILGFLADVGVGTLTDPLTFLGGPLLKGAGKLAKAGLEAAPTAVTEGVEKAGQAVRRATGSQRMRPEIRSIADKARASTANEARAGMAQAEIAMRALKGDEADIVGDILDNLKWSGRKAESLSPSVDATVVGGGSPQRAIDRIALHPGVNAENFERISKAIPAAIELGLNQAKRPGIMHGRGTLSDEYLMRQWTGQTDEQAIAEALGEGAGRLGTPSSIKELKLDTPESINEHLTKNPKVNYERNALKRLSLRAEQQGKLAGRADIGQGILDLARQGTVSLPDDVLEDFASKMPKADFPVPPSGSHADVQQMLGGETSTRQMVDPYGLPPSRGGKQAKELRDVGQMLGGETSGRAETGLVGEMSGKAKPPLNPKPRQYSQQELEKAKDAILGTKFQYADPTMRNVVEKTLRALPPEEAQVLLDMYRGMSPRGGFEKILNWNNGLFKKYAVYGAVIPKWGSIVRNKIGGIYQSLANPEARGIAGGQAKRFASDLADATTQAFGFKKLRTGELSNALEQIDAAFKGSGGLAENAIGALSPELADAVRLGVTEGYVSSEDLIKSMGKSGWLRSIVDWPGKVFQGVEARMRLGAFLDLRKAGKSADDAARIVKDTFYDYATTSSAQRTASSYIPFWKFATKASEQTGKLVGEKPWVGVGLSQLMQDRGDPVFPFMEGKTNIPIGADEEGNDQYITGLGLPFEALNMIPNPSGSLEDFGRDLERGVVGAANPLLKSAFSLVAGEDPYFQTPYGSYDKIPGIGEAGDIGQLYNQIAQTGMIQPIDSLLRTIDDATDPRHNELTRLLDSLTGINVASVDPDRALQQQLQRALESDPDIRQYRSFYDPSGDPAAAELLQQYAEAKKKVKAKRAASAP
jgi:hypothetical protein